VEATSGRKNEAGNSLMTLDKYAYVHIY